MKVLVTGASGFVGRSVIPELARAGHDVYATSRRQANDYGGHHFVGADLATSNIEKLVDGMDAVVHLAARAHVMREPSGNPDAEYSRANVDITKTLASVAYRCGIRHFVFCSSIKAMGESARNISYSEADVPKPLDAYGRSKLKAEQALRRISDESGLTVTALRPPLMYGAGVKGNLLRIMRLVRLGVPLPLLNIENRRSLLGVRNFGSAIASVLNKPGQGFRVFLVSDGNPVSTPALIHEIGVAMHSTARMFALPNGFLRIAATAVGMEDELERLTGSLVVDDYAFRREFDWMPPFPMKYGLSEMADSFLANDIRRNGR